MSDYTPTWFEIRERVEYDTYLTADEFDRWLAEHEAALIEGLADEVQNAPTSDPGTAWFNNDMAQWLREKARERREEQDR